MERAIGRKKGRGRRSKKYNKNKGRGMGREKGLEDENDRYVQV